MFNDINTRSNEWASPRDASDDIADVCDALVAERAPARPQFALWNFWIYPNLIRAYYVDRGTDPELPMPWSSKILRFAGAAGMKVTKRDLIRLARLAQTDIASGRVSKNAQHAVEVLADYQNAAIELLELALEEAAKEPSKNSLFDPLAFLFGQALETLRFDIEAGYRTASEIADSVRRRLVTASKVGASDPSVLLFLAQSFGAAKLDLGEELRVVIEHLIEKAGEKNHGDFNLADPAELLGFVADLVKQADGDAFTLFSVLAESSEGVPDEHRAVMAAALLYSGEAAAMEASIGWLLDPAKSVRQSIANALEDAARKGKVTPAMLRRMIMMRNWLPEKSRAALDAAVAAARRKGVSPAQWDAVEVCKLVSTGVDGSGAIGVLAHGRNKRKNILGSLVLKHGFGVRDAWAAFGVKQKEIEHAFAEVSLMDEFPVSVDFIPRAVGHFLALGHETGLMPPFGLVRFLESVGVSSVQPAQLSSSSLLDNIQDGRAISASAFEDLLVDGSDLVNDYLFLDSWFEAGDEVDSVLTENSVARKKREALIIEKVLEPRREWWAQATAWAAYILYQAGNDERWQEFYTAALAMVQKRPLHEIALMKMVAEQTVEAAEFRQMAA